MTLRPMSSRPWRSGALLLCLGMLTGLTGCQQFGRIGECKQLVTIANAGLGELATINESTQSGPSASAYSALSARYTELSEELNDLELDDPGLDKAVDDVTHTLSTAARLTGQYQKLLERIESKAQPPNGVERLETALHKKMSKVASEHHSNVKKINRLCQP